MFNINFDQINGLLSSTRIPYSLGAIGFVLAYVITYSCYVKSAQIWWLSINSSVAFLCRIHISSWKSKKCSKFKSGRSYLIFFHYFACICNIFDVYNKCTSIQTLSECRYKVYFLMIEILPISPLLSNLARFAGHFLRLKFYNSFLSNILKYLFWQKKRHRKVPHWY